MIEVLERSQGTWHGTSMAVRDKRKGKAAWGMGIRSSGKPGRDGGGNLKDSWYREPILGRTGGPGCKETETGVSVKRKMIPTTPDTIRLRKKKKRLNRGGWG